MICEKVYFESIDATKMMYSIHAALPLCWILTTISLSFLADVFLEVCRELLMNLDMEGG